MSEPSRRLSRPRLAQLRALNTAKGRREQRAFLLDGDQLVRDAIAADAPIRELLAVDPSPWVSAQPAPTPISQADAERLSDTRTPQGVFAVVDDQLPSADDAIAALPADGAWHAVALDAVQDPGNAGALIRTAAAFGCALVLVGPGGADPTHPRAARAATGAWFRIPIARSDDLAADLNALRQRSARIVAASARGAPIDTLDQHPRTAWIFGNEGAGVSDALADIVDQQAAVPIADGVESLNVAVAAGIILHHSQRTLIANQRADGRKE